MTATALVLGGSGVRRQAPRRAADRTRHRGRGAQSWQDAQRPAFGASSGLIADRTDAEQMRTALAGRDWDAVYDVSGFVMAAGGSDIDGLLELLDGHAGAYVYTSSIMAYDQSWVGVFPWTEDQPTNPDGPASYGGFKAVAEQAILARHAANRVPGFGRAAGGDLRAGQQHLRHGTADVPAAAPAPADPGTTRGSGRRLVRPRRRSLRGDDHDGVGARRARRGVQRLGRVGRRQSLHLGAGETSSVRIPTSCYVPDELLPELGAAGVPPAYGHLFKVRHHAMLSTAKAQQLLNVVPRYDLHSGHAHTYEWFQRRGIRADSRDRSPTRCGRRRGTSNTRRRSLAGFATVDDDAAMQGSNRSR